MNKHVRFKSVGEFCAVNFSASSFIRINPLYGGCSCVLDIIFLFLYGIHATDKGRISNSSELPHIHIPFLQ